MTFRSSRWKQYVSEKRSAYMTWTSSQLTTQVICWRKKAEDTEETKHLAAFAAHCALAEQRAFIPISNATNERQTRNESGAVAQLLPFADGVIIKVSNKRLEIRRYGFAKHSYLFHTTKRHIQLSTLPSTTVYKVFRCKCRYYGPIIDVDGSYCHVLSDTCPTTVYSKMEIAGFVEDNEITACLSSLYPPQT